MTKNGYEIFHQYAHGGPRADILCEDILRYEGSGWSGQLNSAGYRKARLSTGQPTAVFCWLSGSR